MDINISYNNKINYNRSISMRAENHSSTNTQNRTAIATTALALGGVTAAAGILGAKKELVTVLKKNGVSFENNIAKKIENGELFTGIVQHNIKHFGLKKEKVKFVNGEMKERLQYNLLGQEQHGYFYKDGKLAEEVIVDSSLFAKNKAFATYTFDNSGKNTACKDGFLDKKESVFEMFSKKYQDN